MKLIYKITLGLIIPVFVTLLFWSLLSYHTMVRKINSEMDVVLKDYSDDIIQRWLSGQNLPPIFNGAYNTYYLRDVTEEYAFSRPSVIYDDSKAYIPRHEDLASTRIRRQIFQDKEGGYHELTVSLPTVEREVLSDHILWWTVLLFVCLFVAVIMIGIIVVAYQMKPLRALLGWLDDYSLGNGNAAVPVNTDVVEFKKLAEAAQNAAERFERQYEERKIFIGNISHELQTPLAVCSNRVEMMLDGMSLDEKTTEELVRIHRSLRQVIRLNKTLLLLSKIENGQFPEKKEIDFAEFFGTETAEFDEMYSYKHVAADIICKSDFKFSMNEELARVLVGNLLKNAYLNSPQGARVEVVIYGGGFTVSNQGTSPLDRNGLFRKFYQPEGRKEGSTGLGLALAHSVCTASGMTLSYGFSEGKHIFSCFL